MAVLNLVTLDWLFTAALFVATVILVKIHNSISKKKEIMGNMPCYPGHLPLLGHAHIAPKFTYTAFIDDLKRTSKDNKGTLHIWIGPQLCAYVANPDDIENVFNRKDAINKGFLFSFFHSHSLGIVTSTTPRWNHMRRLANIPMAHKQMIDSFQEIFQYNCKVLLERLATLESGDFLDINRYLSRCCQDITYGAHFGVNLDIQHNEEFNAQDTVPMVMKLVFERMLKVWLYPDFIYDMTQRGKDFKRYVTHHQNVARKILSERRRILKERKENKAEKEFEKKYPNLMDVYLNEQSGLSDEDIVDNVMDLMLVGFEAMSQTQCWILLLLAMFPQYQDLVQAELDEQLGPVVEEFTLAQLQKCQYLDMVTREALRLFGLPVVIRKLESDVPIEHYTLPAEAEIIIAMCMVHRDARYWDHPDQFYPDHFLPEKVAARPKNSFVPFGLGPRKCPAYTYGMVTIKFVVATLLRKYRFTTKQDYNNLPLELLFMYKPADGFLVRFEPRHITA
uniref:Cytochrome P450 n=1 Tax=Cuerna arida TaxID=1464854 RepID=A0A1B6G0L3_9HEMI